MCVCRSWSRTSHIYHEDCKNNIALYRYHARNLVSVTARFEKTTEDKSYYMELLKIMLQDS